MGEREGRDYVRLHWSQTSGALWETSESSSPGGGPQISGLLAGCPPPHQQPRDSHCTAPNHTYYTAPNHTHGTAHSTHTAPRPSTQPRSTDTGVTKVTKELFEIFEIYQDLFVDLYLLIFENIRVRVSVTVRLRVSVCV